MSDATKYTVSVKTVGPRAIAAVRARLPVGKVSATFRQYLDQVYAARAAGIELDGQNIFVYRAVNDVPGMVDAEFGVGARAPFTPVGSVVFTHVPSGEVATTTHWGDYGGIGDAHEAVVSWCRSNGRALAGSSWEVYGHWTGNPADQRTDIFYLLAPERQ
jgi:effector-binding domain-containing protein